MMKILIGFYILAWILAIWDRVKNKKHYRDIEFYEKNRKLIDSLNED